MKVTFTDHECQKYLWNVFRRQGKNQSRSKNKAANRNSSLVCGFEVCLCTLIFVISQCTNDLSESNQRVHSVLICTLRCWLVHSFVVQWYKITQIIVHQRYQWIHSGHRFIASFDELWSEWSWITNPDQPVSDVILSHAPLTAGFSVS